MPLCFASYSKEDQALYFWTRHNGSDGIAYALRPAADVLSRLNQKLFGSAIKTIELSGPRRVPLNVGIKAWPKVAFSAAEVVELRLIADTIASANEIDGKRTEPFSVVARRHFADAFVQRGAERQAKAIVAELKI